MGRLLADFRAPQEPSDPEEVVALVARLLHRASQSLYRDIAVARSEIQTAVDLLADRRPAPKPRPAPRAARQSGALAPWQMRCVTDHIAAHLESQIAVEDLAGITRLSTSYFFRAFKRSFGMAPHAYVVAARLTLARSLLMGSEEQLCAIALACGFADQAHFSRVFQREMGCSPGKWRREQRANPLAARIALPQADRTPARAVLEAPAGIAQIRLPVGLAILPAC